MLTLTLDGEQRRKERAKGHQDEIGVMVKMGSRVACARGFGVGTATLLQNIVDVLGASGCSSLQWSSQARCRAGETGPGSYVISPGTSGRRRSAFK